MTELEKAAVEAHKRLSDGDGLSFLNMFKAGVEWSIDHLWHDAIEIPSIFGTYLLVHDSGWCVARYYGKQVPAGNTTGWVEISHNIYVEHPKKWLDLSDILPKERAYDK